MSAAERQRRCRERQARGLRLFAVELPEFALADALIDDGRLTEAQSDDPVAVARAIEMILAEWLTSRVTVQEAGTGRTFSSK